MNGNPFRDEEQETQWTDLEPEDNMHKPSQSSLNKLQSTQKKGMSQSRSENDIHAVKRPAPIDTSQQYFLENVLISRGRKSLVGQSNSPSRSTSPIKYLEEPAGGDYIPMSPPTRPRSPMKKLLFGEGGWLGRSMSAKDLDEPSENYRKTGLKQWGEKLKQRVEDLVGCQFLFLKLR